MFSTCFTHLVHYGQWVIFVFTPNALTFGFLYKHNLQFAHIEIGFRCFLCLARGSGLPLHENNSPPIYKFYCSLLTSLSDVIISALLFICCRLFLPCEKLLTCNFAQDAANDGKQARIARCARTDIHYTQVRDHEVVRRSSKTHKTHAAQSCKRATPKSNDGNRKREIIQE